MNKALWNGEPCTFEVINVELTETDPRFPNYWGAAFLGQVRQAIRVQSWGEPFVIDNEDGSGYTKITKGAGMWTAAHRGIGPHRELGPVPRTEWNTGFNPRKCEADEATIRAYWMERDPEGVKKSDALLAYLKKQPKFR